MTALLAYGPAVRAVTPAERRFHDALSALSATDLRERYLYHLPRARRTVLRRLLAAMWCEDVGGLRTRSSLIGGWAVAEIAPGSILAFPVRAMHAFDRVEPGEPVLALGGPAAEASTVIESPGELLDALGAAQPPGGSPAGPPAASHELSRAAGEGFRAEIDDSVANLAVAYARAGAAARDPGTGRAADEDTGAVLLSFERRNTEGHGLHPCTRTRLGMRPSDVLRYDLETAEQVELLLVGVAREHVESTPDEPDERREPGGAGEPRGQPGAVPGGVAAPTSGEDGVAARADVGAILRRAYPHLDRAVRGQVARPDDYVFLPVHPWQWETVVRPMFAKEISDGTVVPVPAARLRAVPTASVRTLLTEPTPAGRLFVKTALDIQVTSTRRTISAHTTNNGPRYSRLLRRIVDAEPALAGRVVPLAERAGATYRSDDEHRARALSALVREGFVARSGETPVPACALVAEPPHLDGSVLAELLAGYPADALTWLDEYARLLLPTVLTCMTKYGIGLEAHLQNCVPTFRNGAPYRLVLRDWGGIRVYPPRLERHGMRVARRPGAPTVTDDVTVLRARAISTALPNHLAQVIAHLVERFGVEQHEAWRRVRRVVVEVLAGLERDGTPPADVADDRAALLAPQLPAKALVRMRLWPDHGEQFVYLTNPLRA